MSTWDSLFSFLSEYSVLFAFPYYALVGFYGALLIGWFFSTDYYDRIYDAWNTDDDDFYVVHMLCIGGIATTTFCVIGKGFDSNPALVMYSILWLLFITPVLVERLITLRRYLRKKRGKL